MAFIAATKSLYEALCHNLFTAIIVMTGAPAICSRATLSFHIFFRLLPATGCDMNLTLCFFVAKCFCICQRKLLL